MVYAPITSVYYNMFFVASMVVSVNPLLPFGISPLDLSTMYNSHVILDFSAMLCSVVRICVVNYYRVKCTPNLHCSATVQQNKHHMQLYTL